MPMIDVHAPCDVLPSDAAPRIGKELTSAALRAEGVSSPSRFHMEITAALIHRMDPIAIQTAANAGQRTWVVGGRNAAAYRLGLESDDHPDRENAQARHRARDSRS